MPDRKSDPLETTITGPTIGPVPGPPPPPAPELSTLDAKRRRGRNLALFITLLAWALVMYIAVMVRIHNDIRP